MPTLYDILGVAPDVTGEELRHAYYRAARRLHPDVNLDAGAADDMRRLNRAWTVLGNPEARREYDRELFTAPPPARAGRATPVDPVEPTYSEVPIPALARLVRPSALILAVLLVIFVVTAYAGPRSNDRTSVPPATTGTQPTSLPVTAADHLGQCLRILPGYDAVVPCSAANDGLVVDVVSASSQCPAGTRAYQLAGLVRIVCLQPVGG
jgi:DnaJ domain